MDETLRTVLFEHQTAVAVARLVAQPEVLADYRYDAAQMADVDTTVAEWWHAACPWQA